MRNKFYWLAVAVGVLVGATLESEAAPVLLSGNATGGDYPGAVSALATGATYNWLAGSDADVIAQDPGYTKMTDGMSEAAGGGYAVYGGWGTTATYTAVFDLKAAYQIARVGVSAAFTFTDGNVDHSAGIGKLTVWTSADGVNYGTAWGQLVDPTPVDGRNIDLSVLATPVDARYVKIEIDRIGSPGNTWYMQARTGEIAIFGGAIPEPLSLGLLTLGAAVLAVRRRR